MYCRYREKKSTKVAACHSTCGAHANQGQGSEADERRALAVAKELDEYYCGRGTYFKDLIQTNAVQLQTAQTKCHKASRRRSRVTRLRLDSPDVSEDDEADVGAGEGQNDRPRYADRMYQTRAAARRNTGDGEKKVDESQGEGVVEVVALEQDLVAKHNDHAARHIYGSQSGCTQ